jgi:putative membrane protein
MALFDPAASARIEAAIHAVEQNTAGEIVVVAVPKSDRYHDVRLLYGAACALAVAAGVHLLRPDLSVGLLFWLELVVFIGVFAAFAWPPLLRVLVPDARLDEAALRRAREEFLEHGVFATRDRSGVLLFVSELEHRVVLLGDEGIHERVQVSGWETHVRHVVEAVRAGKPADGVCQVIEELGAVLAQEFPPRPDDRDELPNTVKQEKR